MSDKPCMVAAVFAAAALLVALVGLALPIQWGDSVNYSFFEDDGTFVMVGEATVWEDISLAASGLGKATSAPENVKIFSDNPDSNLFGLAFDGNNIKEMLYGTVEVPHDYKEFSDIFPHVHWMPTTNNTGVVVWFLEYTNVDLDEVYMGSIVVNATQEACGVANTSQFTNFTVTQTNTIRIASQFIFSIWRDPSDPADTYPDDAILLSGGIHYEKDTLGSRTSETK